MKTDPDRSGQASALTVLTPITQGEQDDLRGYLEGLRAAGSPLALLSYGGPVSNDVASIAFRQEIGGGEALRTGAYGKSLTFTLTTTTP